MPTTDPAQPDAPEPDTEPTTTEPEGSGEAAKWRRRLRDTETERDGLATRLSALQRAEAQRLAGADLADGKDLWLAGVDLPDLLDDAGNVDPAKVADTTAAVLVDRPHWAAQRPVTADPDQGRTGGTASAPSFAAFLRGAGGG
jgi:hypothetical protein